MRKLVNILDEDKIKRAIEGDIRPDFNGNEIKFYTLKDGKTTWYTGSIKVDRRKNESTLIEECKRFIKLILTDERFGINRIKEIL